MIHNAVRVAVRRRQTLFDCKDPNHGIEVDPYRRGRHRGFVGRVLCPEEWVIALLDRRYPGLAGQVEMRDVATPLTRFTTQIPR